MSIRQRMLRLVLLIAVSGIGELCRSAERPNVIVIFTDDHGYADLSSQGIVDDIRTTNIDRLATEGVRMTSGYVTAPQCVPSRAGLLSGRYQNRFGVESNGQPLDGFHVESTIAERLQSAGYATGMSGKWHLGPQAEITSHGFDDVYYKNANRPGWANFELDGSDREPGPERSGLYHVDANSAAACAFIKRHHQQPFFFYCAYRAPHVPLDAPPKYLKRFPGSMPERRRQALAMISAIDDGVGRILSTLEEYGLQEQTVVFFIGDNGAPLKIHKRDDPGGGPGWDGSLNEPLNGEKGMLSEGGIRVPFLMYWKGKIPGGQTFHHPVISLDVAATAAALAGLPADPRLDGVNLVPFLNGEQVGPPHEALYWRWIAQSAVREGRWKYLRGGNREYLFDLEVDREEKHNLLKVHPQTASRLATKLTAWASDMKPPGVATKEMSATWEQYYDHYLDGKLIPPPSGRSEPRTDRLDRINGWTVRGGTVRLIENLLQVRPNASSKGRLFLTASGLELPRNLTAVVRCRSGQGGRAGIAWREKGEQEFSNDQVVAFHCAASPNVQEHRVAIAASKPVIHVRLLTPPGGADIESIEFLGEDEKQVRIWKFDR